MAKAAALKQEAEQAAALAREQEAALAKAREESALMRERMEGQVAAPAPQPSLPPALPSPQAGAGRERAAGGCLLACGGRREGEDRAAGLPSTAQ